MARDITKSLLTHDLKKSQLLMLADLTNSGLTTHQAHLLRYAPCTESVLNQLIGRPVGGGYELPYHDFHGKPLDFSRYKLFTPVKFKTSTMKYWQPPDSSPRLYVPPLIDWQAVIADPKLEVWVTEGEKKAAALCALKVPCVAVSGVWAWTSKKFQQAIIPELRLLCPRPFVLCFDSDANENQMVKGALTALAIEIERSGGTVELCQLPKFKEGKKTGLDDFLVHHKKKALQRLAELEKEPLGLSAALESLNQELMWVEEQQSFFHLTTKKFATAQLLITAILAPLQVTIYDRAGRPKLVKVVEEWIKWPNRRIVPALTYAPGKPTILEDGAYNLWKGWGIEPREGDTKLFDEFLDYLTKDISSEQRTWWLQWMAYPLQHPGTKLLQACVMYSHHQGTGKTLLGYTLGRIYGDNSIEVSQAELHSSFNTWARCKQFIIGDEITGYDKRSDADRLKHMVTRSNITINAKYQPTYELPDMCNYLLTTNQPDAIYLENTDRRNFVVETRGKAMPNSFYTAFDKCYKSDKGAAAIFYKLLNVDLTGFDPAGHAPQTQAKEEMRQVTGTEADGLIRDLLQDPAGVLKKFGADGCELFTLEQLQTFLDPQLRVGRLQLARALRRAGAPGPAATGVSPGAIKVLYAVTNWERWAQATHFDRAAHYKDRNPAATKGVDADADSKEITDPLASALRAFNLARNELRLAKKKANGHAKKPSRRKAASSELN